MIVVVSIVMEVLVSEQPNNFKAVFIEPAALIPFARANSSKRIVGLDVGKKFIGVALSDPTLTIASPFQLIDRGGLERDFAEITKIINENNCFAIMIGLPLNMNASESDMSNYVRQFINQFAGWFNINGKSELKILFWDERLSTAAVFHPIIESGTKFAKRREARDKAAATFILQGILDYLKFSH